MVWDLQHRLQPLFPQVSADGIWENRERRFSTVLRRAALVITGTEVGRREIEQFSRRRAGQHSHHAPSDADL